MQALISQEEWQEYQRLKAESQTKLEHSHSTVIREITAVLKTVNPDGIYSGRNVREIFESAVRWLDNESKAEKT